MYPVMPRGYFDHDTVMELTAIQEQAMSFPREELLAEGCRILEKVNIENSWHTTARCMYRNWLQYIYMQKQLRSIDSKDLAEMGPADHPIPRLPAFVSVPTRASSSTAAARSPRALPGRPRT
jgi:hypothetical protein